jgi:hypothetical protein
MFPDILCLLCVCVCVCVCVIIILILVLETPSSGVCLHCLIGNNYEFLFFSNFVFNDHLLTHKLISQLVNSVDFFEER